MGTPRPRSPEISAMTRRCAAVGSNPELAITRAVAAISLLRPLSESGSSSLSHERVHLQLARAYSGQGNLDEALTSRERINAQGGIAGHRLDLRIFDDYRDVNRTTAGMREALADPDSVAMIGMSSSDRSKAVFEATGKEIKQKNIPFLSAISVNSIIADYPNVFTMRASQDDERLPVLAQFVRRSGLSRPAFVGIRDALYATSLAERPLGLDLQQHAHLFVGGVQVVADLVPAR